MGKKHSTTESNSSTQHNIEIKDIKKVNKSLARRLLGIITNDFPRKVIALFFALLIFFIVDFKIGDETNLDNIIIRLEVPEKLSLMEKPSTVTVRLKGSKDRLNVLMRNQIHVEAIIDEKNYSPDYPYNLKLSTKNVSVSMPGISVIDINPKVIELNIEDKISKKVPVVPRYTGMNKLADNLTVNEVSFAPSTITISGAKSFVDLIDSVSTKPIPLDNANESFEYKTFVIAPDKKVSVSPKNVVAKVEIGKKFSKRTFSNIKVKIICDNIIDLKKYSNLENLNADVRLFGPVNNISEMQSADFFIFIDTSKLATDQVTVPLECWTKDPAIKVENIFPAKVNLYK
ncbi:CdaR family protein [Lentisphaerota bacterium WC36G]|nr:hypothetical protein LJT99_11455 [Lentisphaerae bacterium WC36]